MNLSNRIVDRDHWLRARRELLAREKAATRERDELARLRRELPVVAVTEQYSFQDVSGKVELSDLFGAHSQLVVYHFMFSPKGEAGCPSCSFVIDHLVEAIPHLAARDTAFVSVSRAPIEKIEVYRRRMGWDMRWVSSGEGPFNYDFGVSFRDHDPSAEVSLNYGKRTFPSPDAPGISVFAREGDAVYHTYSTYLRGLDGLMGTYGCLDLTPLGRHEDDLPYPMAWIRRHDEYRPVGESPRAG